MTDAEDFCVFQKIIIIIRGDNMKIVNALPNITSYAFYQNMLPTIAAKIKDMEIGEDFAIDMSATESVDAMAIPLLLNTARWAFEEKKAVPIIYIPNHKQKDTLKNYLEKVGFFNICDFYDYYIVNTERQAVRMDQSNFATYVFTENAKNDSQEERERIEEYVFRVLSRNRNSYSNFWNYWKDYNVHADSKKVVNIVECAVRAICSNSGIHTKTNGIMTLQRNVKLNRVCISVADCGQGLHAALVGKQGFQPALFTLEKFKKLEGKDADFYAIVEAVSYRFGETYGLYNMLMRVFKLDKESVEERKRQGIRAEDEADRDKYIIRIHTNQNRLVFNGRNCLKLEKADTKVQFARKLVMIAQNNYVQKPTYYYPGVHIEIEIPYEKENI